LYYHIARALTQADIGIAIGAGTDVAIESAGIVLIKNDPRDVVNIIKLSKATYSKMVQNLIWATGYNVVAIPLAAGVLAGIGIILPPAIGALLMSVSTVIVALNAQYAEKRATDYIRSFCDPKYKVVPPFEDWEISLY
jgi:Cu2+-exporting ATPase